MKKILYAGLIALLAVTLAWAQTPPGVNVGGFWEADLEDTEYLCELGGGTWDATAKKCTGFTPYDPCEFGQYPAYLPNECDGELPYEGPTEYDVSWCDPNGDGTFDAADVAYCETVPTPSGCDCNDPCALQWDGGNGCSGNDP